MSCCGNKRKQWLSDVKSSTQTKPNNGDAEYLANDKPNRRFEYTGEQPLVLKGISGKTYHFRFKGDKLEVTFQDSLAFMAERQLNLLRK